ncbi:MAG: tRNA (adenosine(37)-N6)-dimethylallyltransferase MiaA [Leptospirales bacterium]
MVSTDLMIIDLVVVGPTASGKTAWAAQWARENNAEIISADSRQIYRGMDIGTAKPDKSLMKEIPHHLIDILTPDESYSAGQFVRDARNAIGKIRSRGKKVAVVGGTGLYVKALLFGLIELPREDILERESFMEKMSSCSTEELYESLFRYDPVRAKALSPEDRYRVLRALWLKEWMGIPVSQLYETQKRDNGTQYDRLVGLDPGRQKLYRRIDQRVEAMMKNGWIDEVRHLLLEGYSVESKGFRSLGYKEILQNISGEMNNEEVLKSICQKTRQFAKRQMTWFRNMAPIEWMTLDDL